ncbi:hypothetical protein GGX14DRAFT_399227 [Mycena pura]|uniref:Uncharacterized protein n=1 Tax=Mycena pura TaxID=153505 RepID=A0AAD6V4M9_9AGAR|nr:hypothetical protein GGX14DRAFT_399227 [Mycena pura]
MTAKFRPVTKAVSMICKKKCSLKIRPSPASGNDERKPIAYHGSLFQTLNTVAARGRGPVPRSMEVPQVDLESSQESSTSRNRVRQRSYKSESGSKSVSTMGGPRSAKFHVLSSAGFFFERSTRTQRGSLAKAQGCRGHVATGIPSSSIEMLLRRQCSTDYKWAATGGDSEGLNTAVNLSSPGRSKNEIGIVPPSMRPTRAPRRVIEREQKLYIKVTVYVLTIHCITATVEVGTMAPQSLININ